MEQAGQPFKGPPATNVVSICGVLFERATTALESDFLRWNASTGALALGAGECRTLLRALFDTYAEQATDPRATELQPAYLFATLEVLKSRMPEQRANVARVAAAYLHFLFDSGQWSGENQLFSSALLAVSDDPGPLLLDVPEESAGYEIRFPELPAGQLDAAMLNSVFARKTRAFARFLAPGREVTETFVLRLYEVPEAAASLGVRARLVGRSIELPPTPCFDSRRVGSMGSVDELMRFWELFRGLQLLAGDRTTVRASAGAAPLLDTESPAMAATLRQLATAYFRRSISGEHLVVLGDTISPFLLEVLLAGASAEPPLANDIWNGRFTLPGVPNFPSDYLVELLRQELLLLQADGLVEIGQFISVPGYLRQCLSDALEGLISQQVAPWGNQDPAPPLRLLGSESDPK